MGASKPAPPSARALDDAMLRLQPLSSRELVLHALAGIDALAEGVLGPKARREERMLERLEGLEQRLQREHAAELQNLEEQHRQLRAQLRSAAQSVGGLREKLLPAELRAQLEQWRKEAR
ncbi:MAG: hypothetical protein ACKO32_08175 [Planctomycetia bacterium]